MLQVGQTTLTLNISDHYGKQVYSSQGIITSWDGNYENGAAANAGLCLYFMPYNCSDSKIHVRKVDFTLIR